jgi:HEPN domain-containing protein
MKERIDLVKQWIKKAENDLISARYCIEIKPSPPLDVVCFHAQQTAEKCLKAFLTYHGVEFEKTHDLVELTALASKVGRSFLEILDDAKKLTPYAVDARYPLTEESTEEEAKKAVEMAEKIKEFALSKLPV